MPSKQYFAPETAVSFKNTGGTVVLTMTSLANGAGRISAQWDRGTGSQPGLYRWHFRTKAAASLTVGNRVELYFAQANGTGTTDVPGKLGTADAAVSSIEKLRNLGPPFGGISADSTTNGEEQVSSGVCFIYSRYVSVVVWNASGQALSGTAGDHELILTPIPPELQ